MNNDYLAGATILNKSLPKFKSHIREKMDSYVCADCDSKLYSAKDHVLRWWIFEGPYCKLSSPNVFVTLTPLPYRSVNRISIGSDNGLSPIRRQAII